MPSGRPRIYSAEEALERQRECKRSYSLTHRPAIYARRRVQQTTDEFRARRRERYRLRQEALKEAQRSSAESTIEEVPSSDEQKNIFLDKSESCQATRNS